MIARRIERLAVIIEWAPNDNDISRILSAIRDHKGRISRSELQVIVASVVPNTVFQINAGEDHSDLTSILMQLIKSEDNK